MKMPLTTFINSVAVESRALDVSLENLTLQLSALECLHLESQGAAGLSAEVTLEAIAIAPELATGLLSNASLESGQSQFQIATEALERSVGEKIKLIFKKICEWVVRFLAKVIDFLGGNLKNSPTDKITASLSKRYKEYDAFMKELVTSANGNEAAQAALLVSANRFMTARLSSAFLDNDNVGLRFELKDAIAAIEDREAKSSIYTLEASLKREGLKKNGQWTRHHVSLKKAKRYTGTQRAEFTRILSEIETNTDGLKKRTADKAKVAAYTGFYTKARGAIEKLLLDHASYVTSSDQIVKMAKKNMDDFSKMSLDTDDLAKGGADDTDSKQISEYLSNMRILMVDYFSTATLVAKTLSELSKTAFHPLRVASEVLDALGKDGNALRDKHQDLLRLA